ncbi:hypothetical protein L202_06061 [Cryptococcus amylolentus CBS 6039]|uniref:CS domain-containing protein n=2 Tax=Cryptococcus amylolentus TaxID=104669 RepID=A0A1E3HJ18_9TREE|nr:hypothetical protein L202_06061 [Cryptococcus amylolentus CBS 6039]ODN76135.1 hypothetical protein L202_06061 [Cryptococcus amylolentus CBS 6039]ODN97216.1 hypothetical protein I350_08196 [Cryptococcus amylolentus CBS 6273]
MAPLHPEITWAQRSSESEPEKNVIYFTINTPDIQGEPKFDIKPTEISFSAKAGDASKGIPEKEFAFDLQLWAEIIPEETKKLITSRAVVLTLRKKENKAEYWTRLTKEKPNKNWIKTDFSKWVDEDEQDEAEEPSGLDGSQGMGGPPGAGGMDFASMMQGMGGGGGGGMPDLASMMGGAGGAGGPGGMDFSKLMEQMGGAGGGAGAPDLNFGDDDDIDDSEEPTDAKKGDASGVESLDDVE